MNNILIKKNDFTSKNDRRMHALAKLKSIYWSEDQYRNLIIEFNIKEVFGYKIAEIGSQYICRLPSLSVERSKIPLSYKWLLECTSFLQEDESGQVDLTHLVDKDYIITVQKKVASNYIFYNLINLVYFNNKPADNLKGEQQL